MQVPLYLLKINNLESLESKRGVFFEEKVTMLRRGIAFFKGKCALILIEKTPRGNPQGVLILSVR